VIVWIGVPDAELLSELVRREPVMVIRRGAVLELVDQFLERLFQSRRPAQQQLHMCHGEVVGNGAAIVLFCAHFRPRVAGKRDTVGVVDGSGNLPTRRLSQRRLGKCCGRGRHQ
jgi:hypothetical protein